MVKRWLLVVNDGLPMAKSGLLVAYRCFTDVPCLVPALLVRTDLAVGLSAVELPRFARPNVGDPQGFWKLGTSCNMRLIATIKHTFYNSWGLVPLVGARNGGVLTMPCVSVYVKLCREKRMTNQTNIHDLSN